MFGDWLDHIMEPAIRDVNTVGDAVNKVADQADNTLNQAGNTLNQAANQAGNTINKVADQADNTLNQAGNTLNQAANQAGSTINKVADQAGNTINKIADQAGNTLNKSVNQMGKFGQQLFQPGSIKISEHFLDQTAQMNDRLHHCASLTKVTLGDVTHDLQWHDGKTNSILPKMRDLVTNLHVLRQGWQQIESNLLEMKINRESCLKDWGILSGLAYLPLGPLAIIPLLLEPGIIQGMTDSANELVKQSASMTMLLGKTTMSVDTAIQAGSDVKMGPQQVWLHIDVAAWTQACDKLNHVLQEMLQNCEDISESLTKMGYERPASIPPFSDGTQVVSGSITNTFSGSPGKLLTVQPLISHKMLSITVAPRKHSSAQAQEILDLSAKHIGSGAQSLLSSVEHSATTRTQVITEVAIKQAKQHLEEQVGKSAYAGNTMFLALHKVTPPSQGDDGKTNIWKSVGEMVKNVFGATKNLVNAIQEAHLSPSTVSDVYHSCTLLQSDMMATLLDLHEYRLFLESVNEVMKGLLKIIVLPQGVLSQFEGTSKEYRVKRTKFFAKCNRPSFSAQLMLLSTLLNENPDKLNKIKKDSDLFKTYVDFWMKKVEAGVKADKEAHAKILKREHVFMLVGSIALGVVVTVATLGTAAPAVAAATAAEVGMESATEDGIEFGMETIAGAAEDMGAEGGETFENAVADASEDVLKTTSRWGKLGILAGVTALGSGVTWGSDKVLDALVNGFYLEETNFRHKLSNDLTTLTDCADQMEVILSDIYNEGLGVTDIDLQAKDPFAIFSGVWGGNDNIEGLLKVLIKVQSELEPTISHIKATETGISSLIEDFIEDVLTPVLNIVG